MPRTARIKNEAGIYHIMVRSISDVPLFRDIEDKDKYLLLIKKYQTIFRFKVYAYCLMTTHAHIALDCCGADISKIMKSINQCYSAYFNKKYNRHGHVFQDRFKSKLVDSEKYLITLSAYIHNNPRDMAKYRNCIEKYKYSSLGVYLGVFQDRFGILDVNYILGHFSIDINRARNTYVEFINRSSEGSEDLDIEFVNEGSECRSERKILIRNIEIKRIIDYISDYTATKFSLYIKFSRKNTELRSLCILVMRSLCNLSFKDICSNVGNMTISSTCRLCEKGYNLITQNDKYKSLMEDIVREFAVN